MKIHAQFDPRTSTLTYLVYDERTRDALVIDPVLDYEPAASKIWTESVDAITERIKGSELELHYILETHAHADHLSGARLLKKRHPSAKIAIGSGIIEVQQTFKQVFDLGDAFATDGRQFDRLLADGERLQAGALSVEVIHTPGHTPACVTYKIHDALFTGDALFMPDQGTGRCDFPAGSAEALYDSITERIYTQPDEVRIFVGHDYQPDGRELKYEATVAEQKATNKQLGAATDRATFVASRKARDAQLNAPRLLFQSVQVNIDAGRLPRPSESGVRYLRVPINVFRPDVGSEIDLADI